VTVVAVLLSSCLISAVGCWLLVVGCWLLVVGCWLLVVGCWLLVVGVVVIITAAARVRRATINERVLCRYRCRLSIP